VGRRGLPAGRADEADKARLVATGTMVMEAHDPSVVRASLLIHNG